MENQSLYNFPTETLVDISANLLETSKMEPDLNRTEKEFLHQNDIINQELRKYDGRLNTCSMILFKIWISLYMIFVVLGVWTLIYFLLLTLKETSLYYQLLHILMLLSIIIPLGLFYGCILLWGALNSKDLFKIEKCIFIFKICVLICPITTLLELVLNQIQKSKSWQGIILDCFLRLIFSGINYVAALYVKRVLLKRDVFQKVSSIPAC